MSTLQASIKKNDGKARAIIIIVSIIVFGAVTVLGKYNLAGQMKLPFDVHIFALANAIINGTVAVLLLSGLAAVKTRNYKLHRKIMLVAIGLSVLFLLSYICHHLFAGESLYGDTDGIKGLSTAERSAAGTNRYIYLAILIMHIPLAGIALPLILWSAYRALSGDYQKHKKMVRYVWPIWMFVAVTGVVVYIMIRPYYS